MEKARPEELSPVERLMYDEIKESRKVHREDIGEVRKDIKSIDRRLTRTEVKSGIWGALSAVLVVLGAKAKALLTGGL